MKEKYVRIEKKIHVKMKRVKREIVQNHIKAAVSKLLGLRDNFNRISRAAGQDKDYYMIRFYKLNIWLMISSNTINDIVVLGI